MVVVECISDPRSCGEGPHWDDKTQSLLSVDIPAQTIFNYDERNRRESSVHIDHKHEADNSQACQTSLVLPVKDCSDRFVISCGKSLALLTWDGSGQDHEVHEFLTVDQHLHGNRFNDGKCDPAGNLWAGTMGLQENFDVSTGVGSLYSVDADGGATTRHFGNVVCSNGLAWTQDGSRFFYIDTFKHAIDVFDCDLNQRRLENRRVVYDFMARREARWPDGMTIDDSGRLWVAMYFGNAVVCIDPERGSIVETLHLPTASPTSCTWGGPQHNVLYVTSGYRGLTEAQRRAQPASGCTFRVVGLSARGRPNVPWNADISSLVAQ